MKRWIGFFLTGILLVTLFGHSPVTAQTPPSQAVLCRDLPTPVPVALSFNSSTDGTTVRPNTLQQTDSPCQNVQAVVGPDNRVQLTSRQFPWSTVGRLDIAFPDSDDRKQCTGTLIGKNLVLINSHCLYTDPPEFQNRVSKGSSDSAPYLVFKPNLNRQNTDTSGYNTNHRAVVTDYQFGWEDVSPEQIQAFDPDVVHRDWAILTLDQDLGDIYGYLGWRQIDWTDPEQLAALNGQVNLAGYSGDFPRNFPQERRADVAGVHVGCSIERVEEDGMLVHDCDTTGGSSGSAITALFDDGNYYIVGLHNAENWGILLSESESCILTGGARVDGCANLGIQVSRWAFQAREMRGES